MSAPSTRHPRWCRQEQCTHTVHRGRLIIIPPGDADHVPVTVQLIKPRTPDSAPAILVASDMGVVSLSLRQAKALQYVTRTLLRSAERGQLVTVPDQRERTRDQSCG